MFTILYIGYNVSQNVLDAHVRNWASYPLSLREQVRFVLIDDGSKAVLNPSIDFPINLTIARVLEDKAWNNSGAKNLGFTLASEGWVFQSDIDHILNAENAFKLFSFKEKQIDKIYYFTRYKDDGMGHVALGNPHMNTYLIHKNTFWEIGGYDEDFSGSYGSEDTFLHMISQDRQILINDVFVTTHLDWDTKSIKKDSVPNKALLARKLCEYKNGQYVNGALLRFPWEIIREEKIPVSF